MRKTLLTLLTLMALAAPSSAQPSSERIGAIVRSAVERAAAIRYQRGNDRTREEQTDRQTKTVRIGASGELDVSNIAGDIAITRGGGESATIEIVKTARGRTADDAREMLGLVEVALTERSGRAEVRTNYPRGDEWQRNNRRNVNVSVAYTITAPAGTRLTVGSISGNIKVTDIKGDLTLNTISGTVRIANAGRIASAKSVSGNVEIMDTQIDGGVEAQSVSGSVLLRKVSARRLSLGSVSGNVSMEDAQCERADAHSISGNVEYSGTLAKNGRYELTSHSGDVRVAVAGGTGFEVEANSFSGSIRSDLSLTLQGNEGERGRRRSLRGVYGDGSAVLNVTTFSGSVVITKR